MPTPLTPAALKTILADHLAWLRTGNGQRANLTGADLTGADLTRADLTEANLTGANLAGADLTRADLTEANLTGADLTRATLTETKLTGADLAGATLTETKLTGATLTRATLTGAKLSGTHGLPPAPALARLDSAIVAAITQDVHALDMSTWHTCATTHCRAGWAIVLAGEPGAALERQYGPAVAGALIYAASYPARPIPNFYARTPAAWAELQASAAAEAITHEGASS